MPFLLFFSPYLEFLEKWPEAGSHIAGSRILCRSGCTNDAPIMIGKFRHDDTLFYAMYQIRYAGLRISPIY